MAASSLVRAEGNARASMTGMLIGAILNCFLDPLFIFGFGWGVWGAAFATVISQVASCTYLLSLYLRRKTHVHLSPADFRIDFRLLGDCSVLGIPNFIQSAGMSILTLLVNTTLGRLGGDEGITIFGMVHKLNTLVIFPIIGIAQGFQPIAGYNYGARRFDRVRGIIRVGLLTVFAIASVCYGVIMIFPRAVMSLFTSDAALVAKGAGVLRVMSLFIPLAALQILGSTYFQAIGKRTHSLALGISRQFLILIPLVLVLPRFFGLIGVWSSYPVADLLSATLTTTLLIREVRRLGRDPAGTAPD